MFHNDNNKTYVIVAGVNGAGKSTFTARFSSALPEIVIDPDRLAAECGSIITGGRKALEEIEHCIGSGVSFCQETTLSGRLTERTLRKVKSHGYRICMVYIGLDTAEDHIARVADRVRKGGHYIPDEVIRRRFSERYAALERVLPLCDYAEFYDNMNDFELAAVYSYKTIRRTAEKYPEWLSEWSFPGVEEA